MRLINDVTRSLITGVLLMAMTSTKTGQASPQASRAAARARSEVVEASDETRVKRIQVLAQQPATEMRFERVDPAQFKATVAGAETLYRAMSTTRSADGRGERGLESALATMDVIYRGSTQRRVVDPQALDLARLAERELTLTYWDGAGRQYPNLDLEVRQSAYVLDDRMHRMADAIDRGEASREWTSSGRERAKAILVSGQAASHQLTPSAASSASQVQALTKSVDRLSRRLVAAPGSIPEAKVLSLLEGAVKDLNQQQVAYSLKMEAPINIVVRTKQLDGGESLGHVIRYELPIDFELSELQNLRFDAVSSPSAYLLGPYRYYFWTEKAGLPTSKPQLINLGEPLLAKREVDLVLLPPAP